MKIEQMNAKQLVEYRESMAIGRDMICPICKNKREMKEFTVDHQHKTQSETNGVNGAGMVRGVICFKCNSTEGRFLSAYKRSGLRHEADYTDFLRTLADYLDQENTHWIHPSEKVKEPKLKKRPFNKIAKLYAIEFPKKKALEFPKSGKATKQIKELSEKYEVSLV